MHVWSVRATCYSICPASKRHAGTPVDCDLSNMSSVSVLFKVNRSLFPSSELKVIMNVFNLQIKIRLLSFYTYTSESSSNDMIHSYSFIT